MIALKTRKRYQAVRMVMTRRLVSSITFLGQLLKLTYLGHLVPTILFFMTSGDLSIGLTQNIFLQKL